MLLINISIQYILSLYLTFKLTLTLYLEGFFTLVYNNQTFMFIENIYHTHIFFYDFFVNVLNFFIIYILIIILNFIYKFINQLLLKYLNKKPFDISNFNFKNYFISTAIAIYILGFLYLSYILIQYKLIFPDEFSLYLSNLNFQFTVLNSFNLNIDIIGKLLYLSIIFFVTVHCALGLYMIYFDYLTLTHKILFKTTIFLTWLFILSIFIS